MTDADAPRETPAPPEAGWAPEHGHLHLPHIHPPQSLLRVLGLVFGLAVVIGGVIGSGIMRAPGLVAQGFTTPTLIVGAWVVGGLIAMLSAMPLVEAGASVPLAGGPYPIAERAFGRPMGFFTGWIGWVQYAASSAFIASVFGEYVHRLGFFEGLSTNLLACALIVAAAALNWTGTHISGLSQSIASAIKGAAFIVLTVVLFVSPRAAPPIAIHPVHGHRQRRGGDHGRAPDLPDLRRLGRADLFLGGGASARPQRRPLDVHRHRPGDDRLCAGQRRRPPCPGAVAGRRLGPGGGRRGQGRSSARSPTR